MKPILFSTPMVRAVDEDLKTRTRRVMRRQPTEGDCGYCHLLKNGHHFTLKGYVGAQRDGTAIHPYGMEELIAKHAPYKPGDILWVREKWQYGTDLFGEFPQPMYAADLTDQELAEAKSKGFRWKPSIHMPRRMARLFLRVVDVWAEQLQDITEEEARREGVAKTYPYTCPATGKTEHMQDDHGTFRDGFSCLWDSLNAARGFGWDANPWIWAYAFERISKEEAERDG